MKQQWVDRFKPLNPNLLSNMREEENKKTYERYRLLEKNDYWRTNSALAFRKQQKEHYL